MIFQFFPALVTKHHNILEFPSWKELLQNYAWILAAI